MGSLTIVLVLLTMALNVPVGEPPEEPTLVTVEAPYATEGGILYGASTPAEEAEEARP